MENTSPQSTTVQTQQPPVQPVLSSHEAAQVTNKKGRKRSDQDRHVTAILESTHRIRRRTHDREIHAILDEIVWLARSI